MQTIRITITSEKPTHVVLTERRPKETTDKRIRPLQQRLEELLRLMPR